MEAILEIKDSPQFYSESFFVSAGESDAEQELSIPVLISKIIEIATAHATLLGIGNQFMKEINGGWVLARVTLEFESYPKSNENVRMVTWIEGLNRHFSTRCFKLENVDTGYIYGYARTTWMIIDITSHANLGLNHINLPNELINGQPAPIAPQGKHYLIRLENEAQNLNKNSLVATHPPIQHCFKYCDIDYYRHVNTVKYVVLILNQFSLSQHDEYMVKRFELSFMREAKYNEPVTLLRADVDDHISFLLTDQSSTPLFYSKVFFKKR